MAFLFDTSAISEALKPKPHPAYVVWLSEVPREEQYTSAIVAAELLAGANRAAAAKKWLTRIEDEVLPTLIVLPFDLACAREYGRLRAEMMDYGAGDADTMIGAVALAHDLTVVTANVRHFENMPGLRIRSVR